MTQAGSLQMNGGTAGVIYHTFIGHQKRRTLCHNGSTGFFSLMIIGSKKWTLWDTSYFPLLDMPGDSKGYYYSDIFQADENVLKQKPHYKFIDRYEATVEEGDILYCPVWMFHAAENESLTLAVRYGVFDPIDYFLSSFGFTFVNIFFSSFLTLLLHSIQGKSHDRNINQKSSKIVKR